MSIVGRGTIASAINDREGFTFFCAGLSNREPISDRQKQNELNRIWRMNETKRMFVYISSLSVYYADSEYANHKRNMEKLVTRTFDNYCILRIGNVTFEDTNPNTLINYLKNAINKNEPFEVQDTYRYLVGKEELNHWVGLIPEHGKHEMNITGRMMKVEQIVKEITDGRL